MDYTDQLQPLQHTYLDIPPEVVQAIWRCMLGGNDHWVNYYNSDRDNPHSGINDNQASVGHITKKGKDLRYRAGIPYEYTAEQVDRERTGWGPWTQTNSKHNQRYSFACWDFEPLKPATKRKTKSKRQRPDSNSAGSNINAELTEYGGRVNRNPTVNHQHSVYREATLCYGEINARYLTDDRILAIYLAESSPHHYHVGIIFSRSLPQAEHNQIVSHINRGNRFKNLDKDSSKCKNGKGTQFRAPLTWKHGVKSRLIYWYCRDERQLVERGVSLRPLGLHNFPVHNSPGCGRRGSTYSNTQHDPTDLETLRTWATDHYPITPHTRSKQQYALLRDLLKRPNIDVDAVRHLGPLWLADNNNQDLVPDPELQNFKTPQGLAEDLYAELLDELLAEPPQVAIPQHDYRIIAVDYQLTPAQLEFVRRICNPTGTTNPARGPLSSSTEPSSSSHPLIANKRMTTVSMSICDTDTHVTPEQFPIPPILAAYFVEALFVQVDINSRKGITGLVCTHQQLIDIIKLRHNVEVCPRHFQRVKMRFCSMERDGGCPYHHASKVELLVEVIKGVRGLPSEYTLAPILIDTLGIVSTPSGTAACRYGLPAETTPVSTELVSALPAETVLENNDIPPPIAPQPAVTINAAISGIDGSIPDIPEPIMDTASDVRCLAALMNVVATHSLDGRRYVALVANCPEPLPSFAHALADLIAAHPEVTFPADKLVGTLRGRIERLRAVHQDPSQPDVSTTTSAGQPAEIVESPPNGKPSKPKRVKRPRVKPAPPPAALDPAPVIDCDDSPVGERRELAELRDRIVDVGVAAFADYLGDPDRVPCVPIQVLVLREPACLEWEPDRLVAALDELAVA